MGSGHEQIFTSRDVSEITPPSKTRRMGGGGWGACHCPRSLTRLSVQEMRRVAGDTGPLQVHRRDDPPPRLSFPERASTRVVQL